MRPAEPAALAARSLAPLAGGAVVIGYFVALHALVVSRRFVPLTVALIVAPWVVALASAIPKRARGTIVAALVALALVAGLAWRHHDDLAAHVDLLLYAENLVFLLALCVLFARTLVGAREALVTGLARIVRNGDMPPDVVRYTRRLTAAWAGFFAVAALVSTILFLTQSRALWSAFVNLALWPLIALFFVVEYAVRLHRFPEDRASSFSSGYRAFVERTGASRAPTRR